MNYEEVTENRLVPANILLINFDNGYSKKTPLCKRLEVIWHIDYSVYTNALKQDCALLICRKDDL